MRAKVALSCLAVTAISVCRPPAASADQAADAYNAYCTAFLFQNNGQADFSGGIITPGQTPNDIGGWVDATVIYVAEDVYERVPTAANRTLVEQLVTTFLKASGTNWSGDDWNDDLGWMITTALRGYQITGNQTFYNVAETNWNTAYNRGWDTTYAGGGVWEKDPASGGGPTSKCALDNDPLIRTGLLLYQFTGDSSYLQKSQNMYDWMKSRLVDASGQVNGCIVFNGANDISGEIQGGSTDNVYDTGSFLEASEYIYRLTGTQSYYDDSLASANYRTTKDAILHANSGSGNQWAYHFVRGLKQFATFNGLWANYETWMQNNANAAWKERNSLNITWDNWLTQTPEPPNSSLARLPTSSAAAIWQLLPQSPNPALVGTFELKNVQSNLSLAVQSEVDASNESSVTQEAFDGTDTSLWKFVSTAGAYYRVQNVATGLFLSVKGNSAQPGASVVASPAAPHAQGNDQWLPLLNADGSYSFFNLSSILALDVPAASVTAGTQVDQGFGNGLAQQSFTLIVQMPAAASDAGVGVGADASASQNDGGSADSNAGENDGDLGPMQASSAAGASEEGAASKGCGCKTAGASAKPRFAGVFAALALGAVAVFRRRRKSGARGSLVRQRSQGGPSRPGRPGQSARL